MPLCKVFTNLPKNRIPADFVEKAIPVLARALRKPEEKFVCMVVSDASICLHGDRHEPAAITSVESIGHVSSAENIVSCRVITDFVHQELGILPSRCSITFHDLHPGSIARNGLTMEQAIAKPT